MSDQKGILTLDLGTQIGWAHKTFYSSGIVRSAFSKGTLDYSDRFEFRKWVHKMHTEIVGIDEIYLVNYAPRGVVFSELAIMRLENEIILYSWCSNDIPLKKISLKEIEQYITGKDDATEQEIIDAVNAQTSKDFIGTSPAKNYNEANAVALLWYVEDNYDEIKEKVYGM